MEVRCKRAEVDNESKKNCDNILLSQISQPNSEKSLKGYKKRLAHSKRTRRKRRKQDTTYDESVPADELSGNII